MLECKFEDGWFKKRIIKNLLLFFVQFLKPSFSKFIRTCLNANLMMADFKNVLFSIEKNWKKINNKNEISEDETERKKNY